MLIFKTVLGQGRKEEPLKEINLNIIYVAACCRVLQVISVNKYDMVIVDKRVWSAVYHGKKKEKRRNLSANYEAES